MESTAKEHELSQMLRFEQIRELSSEDEDPPREVTASRSSYRKPIRNAYSDDESSSDSEGVAPGAVLLPPKPARGKSQLQQAQEGIRWTKEDTTEAEVLSKLQGNGMKDKKIRELAGKFKTLNIAYERERTLRRGLEEQLNAAMKANLTQKAAIEESRLSRSRERSGEKRGAGTAELDRKVMDMRLKNQNMKTELNKAHRLIARELGEGFDVDRALAEENGWKGRQQKIEKLKGRVRELEERLAASGANFSHMSGFSQASVATRAPLSATRTSSLADNKRKELESLKVQAEALRSENESLSGKVRALNSRKLNLEGELREAKGEFEKKRAIFAEKSENDDRFIALLKLENEKLKRDERVVTKVLYRDADKPAQQEALQRQLSGLQKKVQQLQADNHELRRTAASAREQAAVGQAAGRGRQMSAERRKQLEDEYVKGGKYLKRLSAEDEGEIYRAWKESKGQSADG